MAPDAARDAAAMLAEASDVLREARSPSARLDAELLVSHAFGRDRAWLHAHPEARLDGGDVARLRDWVQRRGWGADCLHPRLQGVAIAPDRDGPARPDPRPETERCWRRRPSTRSPPAWCATRRRSRRGRSVLAAAQWPWRWPSAFRTALALGRLRLGATDVSPEALELASENLAAHGVAGLVSLGLGDLLDVTVLPAPQQPDVLVANLPYVPSAELAAGIGSLRFEPSLALDGGTDGLDVVRRLLTELPFRLAPGGVMLLEIGHDQAFDAVREAAESLPIPVLVGSLPDLAGIQRVVRIERA